MTLDALLFAWMEFLSIQKGQRPSTVAHYEKVVRSFFTWTGVDGLPPLSPDKISRDIIGEWLKDLFYEHKNIRPATRASKLSALRSFFAWLRYAGHIAVDPTQGIPSPKVQDTLPQKFSTEELQLLFAAPRRDKIMGLRDLALLKTLYAAGPRVSELVNLDINHVVDSGGYIRLQIIDGKGGKSRTITMRTNPSRSLREWLNIRRTIDTPDPALFIRLKGPPNRLTTKSAQNILKKYARIIGIDDLEAFCHKMRATFASDLYDSGNDHCPHCRRQITYVGPVEVAMLLGHEPTDLATVMRYIAISDRVLRKTAIPDRRFNEIEEGGKSVQIGAQRGNQGTV
jgi:site-specific recombinase XerD